VSESAVIYVRVSTDEQVEHGVSLRAQEEVCRRFAEAQGWPVMAVIREEGISGGVPLAARPGLVKAIEGIGKGDRIVILRRDRIFRADPYDNAVIERAVAARGARVVSTQGEGTASDSSGDIFTRRILDAVGENERLRLRERTREALNSKRAAGERIGQIPYGYRLAADGVHLEVDPADAGLAETVRRLRAEGRSLRAISAELVELGYRGKNKGGPVPLTTIRRILGSLTECPKT